MTSQNLFSQAGQGCQQPRPYGAFPWLWRWGTRFKEKSILDVKTHFKRTETFQYTHFTSCHKPSVKKRFVKEEPLRILLTNSSKTIFWGKYFKFQKTLDWQRLPPSIRYKVHREGVCTPETQQRRGKKLLRFVTQYQPSVSTLKEVLMKKRESYTKPTVTSPNF